MFLKNCWYCAGWDYEFSQSRTAIIARTIAGEPIVLYRKPDGEMVAFEDRCCHRQAPLSLDQKKVIHCAAATTACSSARMVCARKFPGKR